MTISAHRNKMIAIEARAVSATTEADTATVKEMATAIVVRAATEG